MITTLIDQWSSLWIPPRRLTLSQWCEENLILSPEYAARTGPITLHGFQKELFDAFTDDSVRQIVLQCGTQLTKTLFLQACIAYIIACDPGPILLVQPKDEDAKTFARERIDPLIRDCPTLRPLVSDSGAGKENTIQTKRFPGGNLSCVGAGVPGNLARRSIRYLMMDEVNLYEANIGKAGDAVSLGAERLVTFGSRSKLILCCSPTTEAGRITQAYDASDQRQPFVPCWKCAKLQVLKFENVHWDKEAPREKRASTAYYECIHCKERWTDLQRWRACESMQWIGQRPFNGVAGFWLNHLNSPWKTTAQIVEEFLTKKSDRNQLQTFINCCLAEVWKEEGQTPDHVRLFNRRESYPFGTTDNLDNAIVPMRASMLLAGVDVQEDRLEYTVVAYGRDKESWDVAYGVIQAFAPNGQALPVTSPEVWAALDREVLQREWNHESGGTLPILLMAIDTGYKPKLAYAFALQHPQPGYAANSGLRVHATRSVVCVKGNDDDLKVISSVSKEDASRKRQDVRIITVGTHAVKQLLFDSLRHITPDGDNPVPNCRHYPAYDLAFFEGLCSEQRMERGNKVVWERKNNVRNEILDCSVYAHAAAVICGLDRFSPANWDRLEAQLNITRVQPAVAASAPKQPPKPRPQNKIVGRFF